MKLLESKGKALVEEMSNILQMEGTVEEYATVRERVRGYEELSRQLSLDEQKNILGRTGFGKCYRQCLAAHQSERNLMVVGGKLFLTGSYCSVIT